MSEGALHRLLAAGGGVGLQMDDVLASTLPLFRQVAAWHEQSLVAPLAAPGNLGLSEDGALICSATPHLPAINLSQIEMLQRPAASALHIIGQTRVTSDDESGTDWKNLEVCDGENELTHPAFIIGYRSWELLLVHHDALTDVFLLGQLLASVALGLDFATAEDLTEFASHRANLFALNTRLHPVLAGVIVEMTELNRHRRAADLPSIIRRLENYREIKPKSDVTETPEFAGAGLAVRRKLVQAHLRDRLFEISRRNRLIYFKPSLASLNLTVASVPMVMNLAGVRLEQLFVWHSSLAEQIIEGSPMNLGKWLRFEEQPYLPSALDKLIADARRDRAEYGFAQLRLVIAFLHWHDLKEAPNERIVSPLLLLPVELSRRKGVRDQYVIDPTSTEAEVNPALRHHLHQLYGLRLPAAVDLREKTLQQFHLELEAQIRASEPGVALRYVDKPEIRLIHERARQKLAQFQRRQRLRPVGSRSRESYDYSYERENFRPLGLQLFREKVLPTPFPQRFAAGGLPEARMPNMVSEAETQTFSVQTEREANPYSWDFDLCSQTIANFNYRKMSLVRDYGELLDADLASEAFDRVFSLEPRPVDDEPPPPLARTEQWPVVQGDATQAAAVALARTGRSYIIQGPPGTGKSQTITNLIADYVARGRRVLFVCEKRAAIDVVFHRLRQQGLDELCCLIHDSQTDKKGFVLNLKQTYEKWMAEPDGVAESRARREALIRQMEQDIESLKRFDAVMRSTPGHVAATVRELLRRLVELRGHEPELTPAAMERLPDFSVWSAHAELAHRLARNLSEVADTGILARHSFRWLGRGVVLAERPLEMLNELTARAESLLDEIESGLAGSGVPAGHWDTMEEVGRLFSFVSRLQDLALRGQLELLNPGSPLSASLGDTVRQLGDLEQAAARAGEKTRNWRVKLPRSDIDAALKLARDSESSLLRFLKPSWWSFKKAIESRYDFSRHTVAPGFVQVLTELEGEYAALAACEELSRSGFERWHTDPSELAAIAGRLAREDCSSPVAAAVRDVLLESKNGPEIVARLHVLAARFVELAAVLDVLLADYRVHNLAGLGEVVRDLREDSDALPDMLPLLAELADTPPAFSAIVREFALSPEQLEAICARAALEKIYRTERWLPRFDGRVLEHRAGRIGKLERDWLEENAAVLRGEVRRRFRENVQISAQSVTQLSNEQRAFKKTYSAGRRDLEHEFGKTMRYKSIRDLAAGDTGRVVRDLKPIWLMSPLSVSDTLPLSPDLFDVVIFDEASQIPVEEAVPALYRASQVIVVGDEMQLPPTNFFSTSRTGDDESVEVEDEGERVAISLDADSFLAQSAKNLPATLLAWHYRSRSESLIGFSNAAFYAGSLYTIPDRRLPASTRQEIIVRSAEDAASYADALMSRPLSFHQMERSPYAARRNAGEAAYIASLVRELLRRETARSIGIVAFSEAQQGEIESALESLAAQDAEFAARLEQEYVREEDDQFVGLFVKNLENVQGDERDIILLSICYAPDSAGRMLMNFGPINQRGGEKRLNVIFSRARHHMAVVSSIRHGAITNDYNDGAAALKNFLHYAECCSRGETEIARTVLESLNPLARRQLASTSGRDAVISQLASALRESGAEVDEHVGQSRFRCDIGVRSADGASYSAGIIVDTSWHYANPDVAERNVTQPGILRAFGWRIAIVLTRDWYHEPQAVLDRIARLIRDESEPVVEPDDDVPPVPASVCPPEPRVSAPSSQTVNLQRFEFTAGNSAKFWEISQDGLNIIIRFGRIGTNGQTQTKTFDTSERAARERSKLVAEKLKKGYIER